MTKKNYLYLVLFVGLSIALSCNKGEFNPTVCEDCPDLMTCYEGVCDCDTSISIKLWNNCYSLQSNRYICSNPDSTLGITAMLLYSVEYNDSKDIYTFNLYMDSPVDISRGQGHRTENPENFSAQIESHFGSDSIHLWSYSFFYLHNNHTYMWNIIGNRYSIDSLDLRIIQFNNQTYQRDTTTPMRFYRQN